MEQVLREAFDALGKDIVLAHAKDFSLADGITFVAAGEGKMDFPLYIRLLKVFGYNGPLVLHGHAVSQIEKSVALLKRAMA